MSLQSMTGYGRGHAHAGDVTVQVEIHTVNRKQLDIQCGLPKGWAALEPRIVKLVQPVITRGRVTVDMAIDWSTRARARALQVDTPLAGAYVQRLRAAAKKLDVPTDGLDITFVAGLPNVLQFNPPAKDSAQVEAALEKAVRQALRACTTMRRREGRALQQDLLQRIDQLDQLVAAIAKAAPGVTRRYRQRLHQRVAEAGVDWSQADDRLLKEVALFADRADIQEELTRLQSHLVQARRLTRSKAATGRALDFLAQECFREINTIGSKANDHHILHQVVAFKTELERIREQVQNIE